MSFQIEDGNGSGRRAGVSSTNRIEADSNIRPILASQSLEGQTYGIQFPRTTQTTTGGRMLYIKNTSTTKNFHIVDAFVSWDGGNTNITRS